MESVAQDPKERRRQVVARYRAANKEKIRASKRRYREANHEKVCAQERKYAADNREKRREKRLATHLLNTYGLTLEDVQAAWDAQGGKCGICQVPMLPSGKQSRSVCVDHDHLTGKFRELLCRKCNRALGMYENQRDGIDAYLRRHPKKEA